METTTEAPTVTTDAPASPPAGNPFLAKLDQFFAENPQDGSAPKPKPAEAPPTDPTPDKPGPAAEKAPEMPKELQKPADENLPIDDIPEPKFKDEKERRGWQALKAKAKTASERLAELERREAEYKAEGRDPETLAKQIAERDAKLKEYDAIVTRSRLEDHPDFRREFIDGRTKVMDKAKSIIDESGGDANAIEVALNLKGRARVEALREVAGDLDSFQAGRLGRVIDELSDLDERAALKRADSAKAYEELRNAERLREADEKAGLVRNKTLEFEDISRDLLAAHPVLNRVEGHDAWNAQADSILRDARAAVEANPHTNIRAEIEARTAAVYHRLFSEANDRVTAHEAKIAEMESELKSLYGRSPGLAGRGTSADSGKKGFLQQMNEVFGA